jgi:hypothetical protein
MTPQNAALVEQAAAAAESMQEQAEMLAQAVSIFKLSGDEQKAMRAPPRPQRAAPAAPPVAAPRSRPAVEHAARPAAPAKPKKVAAAAAEDWEEF